MSEDLHRAPHRRASDESGGVCGLHDLFAKGLTDDLSEIKINSKDAKAATERIEKTLGDGNVKFENLSIRMDHVEKVVYGAVALSLTAIGAAILGLVLKSGGG